MDAKDGQTGSWSSRLRAPYMRNLGLAAAVVALVVAALLQPRPDAELGSGGAAGYPEPGFAISPVMPGPPYDRGGWWPGSVGDGSMVASTSLLSLSVEDAEGKLDAAVELVAGAGGFVVSSSLELLDRASAPAAHLSARVPADRIGSVLRELSGLGVVLSRSTFASDVSGVVSDLKLQLDLLRAEEAELLSLLESPDRRPAELLDLVERLSGVRAQISRVSAEMDAAGRRVELALLELSLYGSEVPLSGSGAWSVASEFRAALASLSGLARAVVALSVRLLVFGVPLALVAVPVRLAVRRRQRRKAQDV